MHHDIIKTLDRYRYKKITTIFNRFKVYELISAFENDWKTSSNISDVFTKFIVDAKKLNLL
jgi:predicted metal-dependent hydrolase